MSITTIVALLIGLALIGGIAWFFWGPRKSGVRAAVTSSGYQEAMILVKGGYTPDVIIVQHGKPVRFNFRREETAACSEMVLWVTLLIVLVWAVIRWLERKTTTTVPPSTGTLPTSPSALEILQQRYARGEIDAATYEQMRERLAASGMRDDQPLAARR